MTIEALKANLSHERKLLEDVFILNEELRNATTKEESNFFSTAIESLISQIKIISNSILPSISDINTQAIEFAPLPKQSVMRPVQTSTGLIMISKEDKEKFINELKIEKDILKKIRKGKIRKAEEKPSFYKKPSSYVTISSRLFSNISYKFSNSDIYKKLNTDLKKANMYYLPSTYISITLFSMFIVLVFSLIIAIIHSFYNIGMAIATPYPILKFIGMQGLVLRLAKNIGIAFLMPLLTFIIFFMYPTTQAASISKKIENELPFATIHMSSIAGSGVEPRKIFEILARSPEYPAISNEMIKVINQVNLYGYDLVTALRNIGKATPSEKFGGLLNGISTNIVSGGDLSGYIDKRAADTLLEYKLERKKYSNMAETSMDIYIGILVAAPLILMVLLILMNVTGFGFGISLPVLSMVLIGGIALLNIGFLIFLQIQQPS